MTAHELAKKLLELPDVMVTVSGYEGGVNEVQGTNEPAILALNVHEEWYYGKHEYVYPNMDFEPKETKGKERVQAIHIG